MARPRTAAAARPDGIVPVEEWRKNPTTGRLELVGWHPFRLWTQPREHRTVRGRFDYSLEANAAYHPPIFFQDGRFWLGTTTRGEPQGGGVIPATPLAAAAVPAYIREDLARHPLPTAPPQAMPPVTIGAPDLATALHVAEPTDQLVAAAASRAPSPRRHRRRVRHRGRAAPTGEGAAAPPAPIA